MREVSTAAISFSSQTCMRPKSVLFLLYDMREVRTAAISQTCTVITPCCFYFVMRDVKTAVICFLPNLSSKISCRLAS